MTAARDLNREEWLKQAAEQFLKPHLEAQAGRELPPVSVTCGWPSTGGTARTRRVIGQCWDAECSADGRHAIFISPVLEGLGEAGALATLAHELVHALVGVEAKHKGPFAKAAKAVGLLGKPTATVAGPTLQDLFQTIVAKLGDYPHAVLTPKMKEKPQGTRMLKMECGTCGYVARTTRKWLEAAGPLRCPCNPDEPMRVEEPLEDGDEPGPEPSPEYAREPAPDEGMDHDGYEDEGVEPAPLGEVLKVLADEDEEAELAEDEAMAKLGLTEASAPSRCWACKVVLADPAECCPACGAANVED